MNGSLQSQLITIGALAIPSTVLILMGHWVIGAIILAAVLVLILLLTRMHVRSAEQQQKNVLNYAQDATNMGGDPTTVILALHGQPHHGVPPELPAGQYDLRGYQQVRWPASPYYRSPRK